MKLLGRSLILVSVFTFLLGLTLSQARAQQVATASWYGEQFHGKVMANGKIYNMHQLTAAHKSLPLGTTIKVTNLENNTQIIVKITDRGPYINGRALDLSKAAAERLGFKDQGVTQVKFEIIR